MSKRIENTRRDNDNIKTTNFGIKDVDIVLDYYIKNIIKPRITINKTITDVPIIYGSPERWVIIRKYGYLRDAKGKLQIPVLVYKKNTIDKNRNIYRNLDANNPQMIYTVKKTYSRYNAYDKFSVLQNSIPQKEYYNVVVPIVIDLSYDGYIWTEYVEQMNSVIESLLYAESSYWGDKDKGYMFYTTINSFNNPIEIEADKTRIVKSTFKFNTRAYIQPETLQRSLKENSKTFSMSKIKMTEHDTL
jgi:hypothetical protein